MKVSHIVMPDFYSVGSFDFDSEESKKYSLYNFTNRYSPGKAIPELAKDSRMIAFGINAFCKFLTENPVTMEDIEEAEHFFSRSNSIIGKFRWDRKTWEKIVLKYGGYLPLKISGIEDGDVFWPNEPIIEVEPTEDGFGEIAVAIEDRLVGMVSYASACATICRHWLERMKEEVLIDGNPIERANWMIHNFGSRACATQEESILNGMAHLLSFNGTDNTDAAYMAWKYGCDKLTGTSIDALAHHSVLSYEKETDCFDKLSEVSDFASYVVDTFNTDNAIKYLVELAIKNPNKTYVARPDSGIAEDVVMKVCNAAKEAGLYTVHNGKMMPKNLQFIYGDSVNPQKASFILDTLRKNGYNATSWGIFGVGGYLVNTPTRDLFSSAYKLAKSGERDVTKFSESSSKKSIPSQTTLMFPSIDSNITVLKKTEENSFYDRKVTHYFDNGICEYPFVRKFDFDSAKKLCLNNFNNYSFVPSDLGERQNNVSNDIKFIQNGGKVL